MIETQKTKQQPVVVFQYQVCSISSDRSVDLLDLGVDLNRLPHNLRQVLQHPVIPKDTLRPFVKFDARVAAKLEEFACRNDIGYLIPPDRFGELCDTVTEVEQGVNEAKQKLIKELPGLRQAMINRVRDYEIDDEVKENLVLCLEKQMPNKHYIERQVRFWHLFTTIGEVTTVNDEMKKRLRYGLNGWYEGLFGCVIDEVVRKARAMRRDLRKNKERTQVTQKTVAQIRDKLIPKIDGLRFVSKRVLPLADSLQDMIDQFPDNGPLTYEGYRDFMKVLDCLSDGGYITQCLDQNKPLFVRKQADAALADKAQQKVEKVSNIDANKQPVIEKSSVRQQTFSLNF